MKMDVIIRLSLGPNERHAHPTEEVEMPIQKNNFIPTVLLVLPNRQLGHCELEFKVIMGGKLLSLFIPNL